MENKNITIEGITFTPELLEHLKDWDINGGENNEVRHLINSLASVQDYLCEVVWLADNIIEKDRTHKAIASIMFVKDQLTPFVNTTKTIEQ